MRNPMSQQQMPPEFQFRETEILKDAPDGRTIHEDAMGSSGRAPIYHALARQMDPLHWREGFQSASRRTHRTVGELIHEQRFSQTPHNGVRKIAASSRSVNTIHAEAPGARRPTPRGYATVEAAVRGQKLKDTTQVEVADPNKLAWLSDPRRGWREGGVPKSFSRFLQQHPAYVNQMGQIPGTAPANSSAASMAAGDANALASGAQSSAVMSYAEEMARAKLERETAGKRPQPRFLPSESDYRSTSGQFSTRPGPGLIEIEEGKWVRPDQLDSTPPGSYGDYGTDSIQMGDNYQPAGMDAGKKRAILFGLGFLVAGGVGIFLATRKKK